METIRCLWRDESSIEEDEEEILAYIKNQYVEIFSRDVQIEANALERRQVLDLLTNKLIG